MNNKLIVELEHHKRFPNRGSKEYLLEKKDFWNSVLLLLKKANRAGIKGPVLEIGNGPYGFFLSLGNRDDVYCIDPLNNEFKKVFPHMNSFTKIHFITDNIEDISKVPKYKTVLCYNVLDHVDDIGKSIDNILRGSADDAVFLIAVDYYPGGWLAKIMKRMWRLVDPTHPYHFTLNELKQIFGKHFIIQMLADDSNFKDAYEEIPRIGLSYKIRKTVLRPGVTVKFVSFLLLRRLGLGGKGANENMKKMGVFVLKKKPSGKLRAN